MLRIQLNCGQQYNDDSLNNMCNNRLIISLWKQENI